MLKIVLVLLLPKL